MTEYVENLIVGSGFGGSVAAFRLAEADRKVCLQRTDIAGHRQS